MIHALCAMTSLHRRLHTVALSDVSSSVFFSWVAGWRVRRGHEERLASGLDKEMPCRPCFIISIALQPKRAELGCSQPATQPASLPASLPACLPACLPSFLAARMLSASLLVCWLSPPPCVKVFYDTADWSNTGTSSIGRQGSPGASALHMNHAPRDI